MTYNKGLNLSYLTLARSLTHDIMLGLNNTALIVFVVVHG